MLEFTLKEKSWHMWLANFGGTRIGSYERRCGTDICSYIRAVFWGSMALLALTMACLAFATMIGATLYNYYSIIFNGFEEVWGVTVLVTLVLFCLAFITLGVYLQEKYKEWRWKNPVKSKPPGFTKLAYRKFKDKTCFKVNFVRNEND